MPWEWKVKCVTRYAGCFLQDILCRFLVSIYQLYIYMWMDICIYVHIYMYIYLYINLHMCIYICVYTYVHIYIYINLKCICICMYTIKRKNTLWFVMLSHIPINSHVYSKTCTILQSECKSFHLVDCLAGSELMHFWLKFATSYPSFHPHSIPIINHSKTMFDAWTLTLLHYNHPLVI